MISLIHNLCYGQRANSTLWIGEDDKPTRSNKFITVADSDVQRRGLIINDRCGHYMGTLSANMAIRLMQVPSVWSGTSILVGLMEQNNAIFCVRLGWHERIYVCYDVVFRCFPATKLVPLGVIYVFSICSLSYNYQNCYRFQDLRFVKNITQNYRINMYNSRLSELLQSTTPVHKFSTNVAINLAICKCKSL